MIPFVVRVTSVFRQSGSRRTTRPDFDARAKDLSMEIKGA
jgi:hypothetical protein